MHTSLAFYNNFANHKSKFHSYFRFCMKKDDCLHIFQNALCTCLTYGYLLHDFVQIATKATVLIKAYIHVGASWNTSI